MLTRPFSSLILGFFILFISNGYSQTPCDGTDTTAPVIVTAPTVGDGGCTYPQPAATATDDGSGVSNISAVLQMGEQPAVCNLFQPALGANLCFYAFPACMLLMSLPTEYRYYALDSGTWSPTGESTAHLSAVVHSIIHPSGGFIIEVDFSNGMTWEQWSSVPGKTYKADCEGLPDQHPNWMYYILASGSLTGFGEFEGSHYELAHFPANQVFGYQVGLGANNYSPEFGSGGWFQGTGSLVQNGNTIFTNTISGDFMFGHECLDASTYLEYVYTATDNCGNTSSFTQNISACDTQGPLLANMPLAGTIMTPCELEAWQPVWMPDSCDGLFTYTTSYAMGNVEGSNDYLITITIDAMACGVSRSYSFSVVIPEESELPCIGTSCIADINGDQIVTTSDVIAIIGDFLTENELTDLNGDGVVNIPDLIIVIAKYGTMCD